jgi:hypothetical protein
MFKTNLRLLFIAQAHFVSRREEVDNKFGAIYHRAAGSKVLYAPSALKNGPKERILQLDVCAVWRLLSTLEMRAAPFFHGGLRIIKCHRIKLNPPSACIPPNSASLISTPQF